ncbi:MAG: hypothetical protein ACKVOI_15245 [Dongiaceae bacterium]
MQNKNPADTGGKEKLPGYPEDKNPAGTPDPRPDDFPGKAPDIYAGNKNNGGKDAGPDKPSPKHRENPDVNQTRPKDESNPGRGDPERTGGENRSAETVRDQQRR